MRKTLDNRKNICYNTNNRNDMCFQESLLWSVVFITLFFYADHLKNAGALQIAMVVQVHYSSQHPDGKFIVKTPKKRALGFFIECFLFFVKNHLTFFRKYVISDIGFHLLLLLENLKTKIQRWVFSFFCLFSRVLYPLDIAT